MGKQQFGIFVAVGLMAASFFASPEKIEAGKLKFDGVTDKSPVSYRPGEKMKFVFNLEYGQELPEGTQFSFDGYGEGGQGAYPDAWMYEVANAKIHFHVNAHGYELMREDAYYKDFFAGNTVPSRSARFSPKKSRTVFRPSWRRTTPSTRKTTRRPKPCLSSPKYLQAARFASGRRSLIPPALNTNWRGTRSGGRHGMRRCRAGTRWFFRLGAGKNAHAAKSSMFSLAAGVFSAAKK